MDLQTGLLKFVGAVKPGQIQMVPVSVFEKMWGEGCGCDEVWEEAVYTYLCFDYL